MKYRATITVVLGKEVILNVPDEYINPDNDIEELAMQLYEDGIIDIDKDTDIIETSTEIMRQEKHTIDEYIEIVNDEDIKETINDLGWSKK